MSSRAMVKAARAGPRPSSASRKSFDEQRRSLAEREGFEPPIRLPVCRISSAVLSTTQPPLRKCRARTDALQWGRYLAKRLRRNKRPPHPSECGRSLVPRHDTGARRAQKLFQADIGAADDLAPLVALGGDVRGELGRRAER